MPFQINYKGARTFKKFSPFPEMVRPFTEAVSATQDIEIPAGVSMPELIRRLFKVHEVEGFHAKFGFLDRDNKERAYSPGLDDPFVFKDASSIDKFGKEALSLINVLTTMWKSLGLPTVKDEARQIIVPDSGQMFEALQSTHPLHKILLDNYDVICFITSNVDIMKKACVVRNIYPGWWAQSYAGKNSPDPAHFGPAMRALTKAIEIVEASPRFATLLGETQMDLGDPLDTNVGYPYFSAEISKSGEPMAKQRIITLFKGLGDNHKDFDSVVKEIAKKCRPLGLQDVPLLIAPIRRASAGYKYFHEFQQTSTGLTTLGDARGMNSVRVAWMSPYIYNLYLSPLQARWKTVRKLMPGMFFDGSAKKQRLKQIKDRKAWLAEADYSNYDRFMPINLFSVFYSVYLDRFEKADYWKSMCSYLHKGLPIIWPDYVPGSSGRGWVFRPTYGLLSGVKVTSEEGTFINALVNVQALIDSGILTEKTAVDYLTMYVKGGNSAVGSGKEYFFIMSDDDLLVCDSPDQLYKLGKAFSDNSAKAGLKGSLEIGDRFLMRHCEKGKDSPVPSRIWQNTLSNEEPYTDILKFMVGLAMRTDGILGHKTYDPFVTGRLQSITQAEAIYSLAMLKSLKEFLGSATHKVQDGVAYLDLLIEAGELMTLNKKAALTKQVTMPGDIATRLDNIRKGAIADLAKAELAKLSATNSNSFTNAWIYQLHKDRHVPSSMMLLDQIEGLSTGVRSAIDQITGLESTFFRHALDTVGIDINMKLKK